MSPLVADDVLGKNLGPNALDERGAIAEIPRQDLNPQVAHFVG
jgi:hypothetical protein